MISHLRGVLARKNEAASSIEVDVGGVWYEVELPAFVWRALEDAELDSPVELETYYFLTANAPIPRLIGFQRAVEREFFKKLLAVPNVGPTTALKALVFSVSAIARWIESGYTAALGRLPGIGKRTAETIVAQLRGKVVEEALLQDERFETAGAVGAAPARNDVTKDAIDALVGLGYSRMEADRLVQEAVAGDQEVTVEDVIRAVFRKMNRG